jgi:hypothetical protein
MAKTLNQFIEGYLKVKNPDEQKFVDKHVVAKHADRNGNDDEVFKGSKVKMDDRRKTRHGYNPGEDEKVYEELKGSQHKIDANKNGKVDAHDFKLLRGKKKKVAEETEDLDESAEDKHFEKQSPKMQNAINLHLRKGLDYTSAVKAASKHVKEEAEEIEEKLNMDKASMGTVIKDFQKSDAPQFKGKSQDKRRAMAIAAKLTAERGGKPLRKEEKLADLLDDLTETHRRTMLFVFDKLNEDNQKKFLEACETPEGVESMLDFSISHRGE